MIKYKLLLISFLSALSLPSLSDVTGAGDAAVFSQLVTMTNNLVEQVETLQETLDVSKKLEELEQAKAIRSVSDAGKNLMRSMDNLNSVRDTVNGIAEDPFGTDRINIEIDELEKQIEDARSEPNGEVKARKYSRILRDLKNVRMLGQMVEDNKTKIGEGMNDSDAVKSTAESSTVIADVLLKEYEKKSKDEANNASIMEGIFKAGKYDNIGDVQDFRYE